MPSEDISSWSIKELLDGLQNLVNVSWSQLPFGVNADQSKYEPQMILDTLRRRINALTDTNEHKVNLIAQAVALDEERNPEDREYDADQLRFWVLQLIATIEELRRKEGLKIGVSQTVAEFMEVEQPRLAALAQHARREVERKNNFLKAISKFVPEHLRAEYEAILRDEQVVL